MIRVTALVREIERKLDTKLSLFRNEKTPSRSVLKASAPLSGIPDHLHSIIGFVSLNHHTTGIKMKGLTNEEDENSDDMEFKEENIEVDEERRKLDATNTTMAKATISINTGSATDIFVYVQPICDFENMTLNAYAKPCNGSVTFEAILYEYYRDNDNVTSMFHPFPARTNPTYFDVDPARVYCTNKVTGLFCDGNATLAKDCYCGFSIAPLPQYRVLQLAIYTYKEGYYDDGTYIDQESNFQVKSSFFVLTKTQTPKTVRALYNIPSEMTVRYGANCSAVFWYGGQFSNSDMLKFMRYVGEPDATVPKENIISDFAYNTSTAKSSIYVQTYIDYTVALTPGGKTVAYLYEAMNPYNFPGCDTYEAGIYENEGFLTFLWQVSNETYPTLVFAMEKFDTEDSVFNDTLPGQYAYGVSCDEHLLAMGLRGLTVVATAGGGGALGIRNAVDIPARYCESKWQMNPSWPASSPYVLTVGGTQLTDAHQDPVCRMPYTCTSKVCMSVPYWEMPKVQCDHYFETLTQITYGGGYTTHSGFSVVYDRDTYAPWQSKKVSGYLAYGESYMPPSSYFNEKGRAYPDIALRTTAFVTYYAGKIARKSVYSTSFGALVSLWSDIRLSQNRSSLGFINPFLYQIAETHPETFRDVTTGI